MELLSNPVDMSIKNAIYVEVNEINMHEKLKLHPTPF